MKGILSSKPPLPPFQLSSHIYYTKVLVLLLFSTLFTPTYATEKTETEKNKSQTVKKKLKQAPVTLHKYRFITFGTYIDIIIAGSNPATAQSAFNEIEQKLLHLNKILNPWKPGALAKLNQVLPNSNWSELEPTINKILMQSIELSELSDHLFNPAIGKLIKLWGFHDSENLRKTAPDVSAISQLTKNQPRMTSLKLKGNQIKSTNAHIQIDLGAIAKGYAVDLAIEILKRKGINNAIINAGGDLKCIGTRGNRPWRIAIRNPKAKNQLFASVLVKHEEAIFTSGDYERYFKVGTQRYHHILDPRTGYPANQTHSVTVIHSNGTVADAAATALFIAGPKEWPRIAKRMQLKLVLLIDKQGTLHLTSQMQKRLTLNLKNPKLKITTIK